jgi:hypothetical protein
MTFSRQHALFWRQLPPLSQSALRPLILQTNLWTSKATALIPLTSGVNAPLYTKKQADSSMTVYLRVIHAMICRYDKFTLNFTKEAEGVIFPFNIIPKWLRIVVPDGFGKREHKIANREKSIKLVCVIYL